MDLIAEKGERFQPTPDYEFNDLTCCMSLNYKLSVASRPEARAGSLRAIYQWVAPRKVKGEMWPWSDLVSSFPFKRLGAPTQVQVIKSKTETSKKSLALNLTLFHGDMLFISGDWSQYEGSLLHRYQLLWSDQIWYFPTSLLYRLFVFTFFQINTYNKRFGMTFICRSIQRRGNALVPQNKGLSLFQDSDMRTTC